MDYWDCLVAWCAVMGLALLVDALWPVQGVTSALATRNRSAVMRKQMQRHWRTARMLALWHGGKPSEYIAEVMRGFSWTSVPSVWFCSVLLILDVVLAMYMLGG